jgi:hypothetical protein
MTGTTPDLTRLGDALEQAAHADLGGARRRRRRPSRRLLLAGAVLAIALPGAAIATTLIVTNDDVAASLPAGTLALAGTSPTCTTVRDGVEYHCLLARAPAPEVQDWLNTVEPTVDAAKHVNGGCRSLRSDGTEWECYLGEEAVTQKIVGEQLLGEYAPTPGVG